MTARDLEPLLAVAAKLAAPFDLRSMLVEVVEAAKQVLKADRGTVWLYDAAADELVLEIATDIAAIRIPAGTRSGRTFRVKGRGIDNGKRTGDLLVTVDVAVPTKLTADERRAVEALAAAAQESPRDYLGLG